MEIEEFRFQILDIKEHLFLLQKDSPPEADVPLAQNPRPEFIPQLFGGRL
jgi:hypothetical protein